MPVAPVRVRRSDDVEEPVQGIVHDPVMMFTAHPQRLYPFTVPQPAKGLAHYGLGNSRCCCQPGDRKTRAEVQAKQQLQAGGIRYQLKPGTPCTYIHGVQRVRDGVSGRPFVRGSHVPHPLRIAAADEFPFDTSPLMPDPSWARGGGRELTQ